MRFGLSIPIHKQFADPKLHVELAVEAESSGWDGYFLWDHIAWKDSTKHAPVTDPWLTLAAVSVKTERIFLGPMVTPLARRRPWKVGRETIALDHLSNGRFILGIGLGAMAKTEFLAFGEEGNAKLRGQKLDEALDVIVGLWSGQPFSFDGEFYKVKDAHFLPLSVQSPRIPIWVAGYWRENGKRKPFRRAAQHEGVFPLIPRREATPNDFKEIAAYISGHRTDEKQIEMICGRTLSKEGIGTLDEVNAFAEAGVTWWMPGAMPGQLEPEEVRKLIRRGPPRS